MKLLIVMPEADRKNRGREEERCGGGGTKADQSRLNKRRTGPLFYKKYTQRFLYVLQRI